MRLGAADRLLVRAWKQADDLGHGFVGDGHFLLALLDPADESLAAEALRASGLTREAYRRVLARLYGSEEVESVRDPSGREGGPNPALYATMGRAQGLAAGLGATQTSREHLLVAILWDGDSAAVSVLTRGEWIPSDGDPSREVCGVSKTRPAPPESVLMQREPGFGTPHGSGDLVTVALP